MPKYTTVLPGTPASSSPYPGQYSQYAGQSQQQYSTALQGQYAAQSYGYPAHALGGLQSK